MTETPELTDLDFLMSTDPLSLTDRDIDVIIAYQRNARAQREAGIKPKRERGPGVKLDLKALGLIKDKPKSVVGTPGGLRRI